MTGTTITSIPQNNHQIKRNSRSGEYVIWRSRVADAYRDAGMPDEADLYDSCSDPSHFFLLKPGQPAPAESVGVITCSENPGHMAKAVCPSCQLRTCPDCAHRETARLLARYLPTMKRYFEEPYKPGWKFRSIVFTSDASLFDLNIKERMIDLYNHVWAVFESALKSRRSGPVSVSDCGFLAAGEFGPRGLKFHVHCIYYGPWLDQDELVKLWHARTGNQVVWVNGIGAGKKYPTLEDAVAEVLKYSTKFWKRQPNGQAVFIDPAAVPVLHKVLSGTRRVRSRGLFYRVQEPQHVSCCPTCSAVLTKLSPAEWDIWNQTGWLPEEVNYALKDPSLLNLILGNKSPPERVGDMAKQEILL